MATWTTTLAAEILRWLPAKSILRFRSVSKQWASLCSEPYLAKLRRQNLDGKLIHRYGHLYALDHDSLDYALEVDDLLQDSGFIPKKVLGCSNGKLCLAVFDLHRDPRERYDPGDDVVVICDLTTGARRVVPPPGLEGVPTRKVEETEEDDDDERLEIPYHPHPMPIERTFSYGFGFNPSTEDYKLVRISQCTIRPTRPPYKNVFLFEAKVYSTKTDSWSKIDQDITHIRINDRVEPVPSDGLLYWMAGASDVREFFCHDEVVVAFDLTDENFLDTVYEEKGSHVLSLGAMGGKVCVMTGGKKNVKLWKIEEHGHVWTLLGSLGVNFPISSYRTMHFSKNGDQVLMVQLGYPHHCCLDFAKKSWSYEVKMKYISIQGRISTD